MDEQKSGETKQEVVMGEGIGVKRSTSTVIARQLRCIRTFTFFNLTYF